MHRLATRLAPRLPPVARGLEQAAVQAEVREEQREYVEAGAGEDDDVDGGVALVGSKGTSQLGED